ncbi:MAG: hypothetical protein IJ420_01040 [Lachnospiraceae bacterium]|nr:hypothetical protein [Lachnospiraceae bacterium]
MREFLRVIWNKKTILFALILLLINVTFCLFQCNDSKEITLTGDALTEYLNGYDDFLAETMDNVSGMLGNSLFAKQDSFARKNIEKSAVDYGALSGLVPEEGENRGIVIYTRFQLTHFLVLGFVIYLVLRFLEEEKKGLQLLVRSTALGRIPLLLWRVGTLLFGAAAISFLLYGSTLLVVQLRYPGADLGRAIQSVPEFLKCTYQISIREYLFYDMLCKALAASVTGLLLYALSVFTTPMVALVAFSVAVGLEYLCYLTIVPTSVLAGVKYVNLCAMLVGRDGFINYLNLNFFGKPILILELQLWFALLLLIVLPLLGLIACAGNRAKTVGALASRLDKILAWFSRHRRPVGGFTWEARKLLGKQMGFVILLLAAYLAYSASLESRYADLRNPYEMMWYEEFAGPITEDSVAAMEQTMADMEEDRLKLEASIARLKERLTKLMMEKPGDPAISYVSQELEKREDQLMELLKKMAGLNIVLPRAYSGLEYTLETGRELWLLEPYTYQLLLENDSKTYERNRLYILLAVVAAFSGCMAYEYKAKMEPVLRTSYRGKRTVVYKMVIVVLCSAVTALGIHMIQFVQIGKVFPYHSMDCPVQSIECMRDFPFSISITGYLCLLYGWRCLYAAAMGLFTMLVSRLVKDRVACIALCAAGLLVPVFLSAVFGG